MVRITFILERESDSGLPVKQVRDSGCRLFLQGLRNVSQKKE